MKDLSVGQKVRIEFLKDLKTESKGFVTCEIKNIKDGEIELNFPIDKLKEIEHLQEGVEVYAFVYTRSGVKVFNSLVLSSPDGSYFSIEYPNDYEIIQRRKFIRADYKNIVTLINLQGQALKVMTLDIGGLGVKIEEDTDLLKYNFKILRFKLEENSPMIEINGRIVKMPHFKEKEYLFFFEKIDEYDRNKIIKKCLEIEASKEK